MGFSQIWGSFSALPLAVGGANETGVFKDWALSRRGGQRSLDQTARWVADGRPAHGAAKGSVPRSGSPPCCLRLREPRSTGGIVGPRGATAPCASVRPPTFPSEVTARQPVPRGALSKLKSRLCLAVGSLRRSILRLLAWGGGTQSAGDSPTGGVWGNPWPPGFPLSGLRAPRLQSPPPDVTLSLQPDRRLDRLEAAPLRRLPLRVCPGAAPPALRSHGTVPPALSRVATCPFAAGPLTAARCPGRGRVGCTQPPRVRARGVYSAAPGAGAWGVRACGVCSATWVRACWVCAATPGAGAWGVLGQVQRAHSSCGCFSPLVEMTEQRTALCTMLSACS